MATHTRWNKVVIVSNIVFIKKSVRRNITNHQTSWKIGICGKRQIWITLFYFALDLALNKYQTIRNLSIIVIRTHKSQGRLTTLTTFVSNTRKDEPNKKSFGKYKRSVRRDVPFKRIHYTVSNYQLVSVAKFVWRKYIISERKILWISSSSALRNRDMRR